MNSSSSRLIAARSGLTVRGGSGRQHEGDDDCDQQAHGRFDAPRA
jgi:hypothetical protein